MKTLLYQPHAFGVMFLLLGWLTGQANAQTITQQFTLQPGWNSIYLEVDPVRTIPDEVFAHLPVASVWSRAERLTTAAFIQDPSEEAFNRAEWLAWFPAQSPEAILGNLYTITGSRAYLVRTTNSAPISWSVTGRPAPRRVGWIPDNYNLRGFPVDEANPPSFLSFFRFSAAHFDAGSGQLQKIFRLNASGRWVQVSPADTMRRGEACWVYTKGASDYEGAVEAQPPFADGVSFEAGTEELTVSFRNRTTSPRTVSVAMRAASITNAIAYRTFRTTVGYEWGKLPELLTHTVPAGSTSPLRLAIRRSLFTNTAYSALLEVSDGLGSKTYLPVTATLPSSVATGPGTQQTKGSASLQGLWVGGTTIDAVGEVNRNPTNLTPVQAGFPMRLLLHVDSSGQARLLKEVIQMWRDGTYTNDVDGQQIQAKPGGYVLLTADGLLGQFQGATLRDGVPVGRRLSTAAFDFDGGTNNSLLMAGSFAISNKLVVNITLGPNFPTNPFRHKYHPDHDNLNANWVSLTNNFEAYQVTRAIELEFTPKDPTGASASDYGYSVMAGIYRETLTGLHKNSLRVQGTFRLTRACYTGELNPSPNP